MSESTSKPGKRKAESPKKKGNGGVALAAASTNRIRNLLASVIWIAAVVAALILAVGALLVALDMNRDNAIVKLVLDVANGLDLGVFKDFQPDVPDDAGKAAIQDARQSAETKSVMVNWGIAAVIYLIVGKVADRVIRPKS